AGGRHRLVGDPFALFMEGLEASSEGAAGAGREIGTIGAGGMLRLWLAGDPDTDPVEFCSPGHVGVWRTLFADPSAILGFDCAAPAPASEANLAMRQSHFARPQKN